MSDGATSLLLVLGDQPPPIFFDGWPELVKVLVSAPIVYILVILFIRISGKRTTSQMNNFDWIVTVAMGSMIASPILIEKVVISEALLGIGVLLVLQYVVTKLSVGPGVVEGMVKASPRLVVYDGRLLRDAMRKERVTEAEVLGAIRESGHAELARIAAVVLESDANLSVIPRERCADPATLVEMGLEPPSEPG